MATRVRRTGSRPRGSPAQKSAEGASPRSRNGGSARRPASGRKTANRRGRYGRRYGRGGYGRGKPWRQPPTDPFLILFGWIGQVIAATWMVAAHAAGAAVRAVGRSARDLDPLHRRDGVGLALLGAAVVTAAATWFGLGSVVGRAMSAVVRGGFGSLAWTVPLLLALLAWRFLRHPDRNAETGRITIGGSALVIGTLGLVHIAHGTPSPTNGAGAVRAAGGMIGYVASAPLVAGLTSWVAAPLLALLCGFGLLVVTGTPLHRVPNRLAGLRGTGDDGEDAAGGPAGQEVRPGRKRPAAIEAGDHSRPYDSPLLRPGRTALDGRGGYRGGRYRGGRYRGGWAGWPGACRARRSGRRGRRRRAPARRARVQPAGQREAAGAGRGGRRPERAAHPRRVHRLQLYPAAHGAAAPGDRPQGADAGQRRGGACPYRGARAVRGGRQRHRVQPRADRDPV